MRRTTRRFPRISFKVRLIFQNLWQSIHPASRGVAAHTAGLFRSVRGAKGGFPPWGLPKLGNFHFSHPWGLPKLGNFHFSPPWGLPKLGNFHFSPPWGLPKLGNFHFPPRNVSSQAYGNLHVFCYNVSPKHLFLQCFQCSGIQKPCKILLCTMFFSFLAVFPLPESYQNDPKFHFNTLLRSDTQKSSKNVENTTVFWSRCETVFGPPS